jgi:hypothetical protein
LTSIGSLARGRLPRKLLDKTVTLTQQSNPAISHSSPRSSTHTHVTSHTVAPPWPRPPPLLRLPALRRAPSARLS